MRGNFWWPKLGQDVRDYAASGAAMTSAGMCELNALVVTAPADADVLQKVRAAQARASGEDWEQ